MSKKSSLFDDLFFIASKLPWWVSVVIAVGGYIWLHSVATAPIPVFADVKHLDSMVFNTAARTFAGFGQYLLPVILLAGALASVLGRRKRRNLLASMTMPGGKPTASKRPGPRPTSEVPKARVKPVVTPKAAPVVETPVEPVLAAPACPHCRKPMVIRKARSGANAGGDFWGCSAYPKCRGMRGIFKPM